MVVGGNATSQVWHHPALMCRVARVVRVGKLESTSEEVKALHIDALSESRMHADDGVASAAGTVLVLPECAHARARAGCWVACSRISMPEPLRLPVLVGMPSCQSVVVSSLIQDADKISTRCSKASHARPLHHEDEPSLS